MGYRDHDEGLVDHTRHEVKREALKRKRPDRATELGVDEGGAGVGELLSVPNGILVGIEEDETEAMTLLVVSMSSELELTLGLPKQLERKY
jgi:hypothetical protein